MLRIARNLLTGGNFRLATLVAVFILVMVGCNHSNSPTDPSKKSIDLIPAIENLSASDLYIPSEVLIVLHDSVTTSAPQDLFEKLSLDIIFEKKYNWGTLHRAKITDSVTVENMCGLLKSDSRVKFAEPNYLCHFSEAPYTPNDPMWEDDSDPGDDPRDSIWEQWGPAKLGASIIWNETKGDENLVVAVLDTGIRLTHEDLNENIWINIDENPTDGIDNDLNGWIDDWWGWNCWEQNNIPFDLDASNHYHGTACAGVIAGVQDNFAGMTGIAPGVQVMAIRADCGILATPVANVVEGWDYAKTNGAKIISMSFYVEPPSEILETAAFDTWDDGNGPLMFAAAGNSNSLTVRYPAGYECVQAVSAVVPFERDGTPHDELKISPTWGNWFWGSNYGDHLSVAGYGEKYFTAWGGADDEYWDGDTHWFFNGTSCATPTVAGVAALLVSTHPGHDGYWYRERLEQTADDLHEPGYDIYVGNGRVNALRAVYGSDRFSDSEDLSGYVPLVLGDSGIELYDSIHDVDISNPFSDPVDLYKFTATKSGCLEFDLDIFTWGEDLDIALYPNPWFSQLIVGSTGENHAGSSREIMEAGVIEDQTYFLKIFSPELGNSSTYGLNMNYIGNEISISAENLAPATVSQGQLDVPFLKLDLSVLCAATLNELIVSKFSTAPGCEFGALNLYLDSNENGDYDPADLLIATDPDSNFNRTKFSNLDLPWDGNSNLILFITADISPTIPVSTELQLSLDNYKSLDITGTIPDYNLFPLSSNICVVTD